MSAEKTPKGASETEKDQPARSAEPSARNDKAQEFTLAEMQDNSERLFNVPAYVVAGAIVGNFDKDDPTKTFTVNSMKRAVEAFLAKEITL